MIGSHFTLFKIPVIWSSQSFTASVIAMSAYLLKLWATPPGWEWASDIKTFHTLNYEGTTGWSGSSLKTDLDDTNSTDVGADIAAYDASFDYELPGATIFNKKEGKYYSLLKNTNSGKNTSNAGEKEILFGDSLSGIRGAYLNLKLSTPTSQQTTKQELFAVSAEIVKSS